MWQPVSLEIEDVEWDESNLSHAVRHEITPALVEALRRGRPLFRENLPDRTADYQMIGSDSEGRVWTVVLKYLGTSALDRLPVGPVRLLSNDGIYRVKRRPKDMAKQRKGLTDEELARYYQERRDDESLWSQTPAPVTIRKEGGTLFSLRLPADELEVFRQQAEKRGTTVSALLRDGARLLLQQDDQPGTIRYSLPLNLYRRVVASKQLIEAVLEEPQDVQDCLKLLIELGLERILTDIISGADAPTLVKAMAQLAARAP